MIQIRHNVFETNSSSTHSLCICTKQEYEDFQNRKLLFYDEYDKLITPEEAINELAQYKKRMEEYWSGDDIKETSLYDIGIYNKDEWEDNSECLEEYCKKFTTPSGDEMVVFGAYGEQC